jgi:hypothetical protein
MARQAMQGVWCGGFPRRVVGDMLSTRPANYVPHIQKAQREWPVEV